MAAAPAWPATWMLSLERSGFFGTIAGGLGVEFKDRHSVGMLIGQYSNGGERDYQVNIVYRYSRWVVDIYRDISWRPLQAGIFGLRTFDKNNYFIDSPSQYPTDNYYDPTRFRMGLELGSTLLLDRYNIGLSYRIRILDNGLIAIYNNSNRDLQYYISSGFGLQYRF